jgi:hypothetical protein
MIKTTVCVALCEYAVCFFKGDLNSALVLIIYGAELGVGAQWQRDGLDASLARYRVGRMVFACSAAALVDSSTC